MFLVILSSFLGIVAFLPLNLYFFGFIFLVPFFYFLYTENRFWKLFLGAFVFRAVLGIGTVYYTLEPLLWITTILIFSSLALAIFVLNKIFTKYSYSSYAKIIYIPLIYVVFDILEAKYSFMPTYIITAGNTLGASPFVGLAKYGGLLSLEFFVILVNVFFLLILLNLKFLKENKNKFSIVLIGLCIFFFSTYALSGYFLKQNSKILVSAENHLNITAVALRNNFSLYNLSQLTFDLSKIETDLLVLPEELFVQLGNKPFTPEEASGVIKNLNVKAKYIVGTFHLIRDRGNYDTAILFDNQGGIISQYDKNKLIILGEYWPFAYHPSFYDFFKNDPVMKDYALFNSANSYTAGAPKIMQIENSKENMLFATLICLEAHYPDLVEKYRANGAKFIINPLSNRWVSIGSDHFGYLTGNLYNVESVQSGLPIIVSGINSFAGVFSPNGERKIVKYANMESYKIITKEIIY
jgi:apolipoprotein N-acyltransferase